MGGGNQNQNSSKKKNQSRPNPPPPILGSQSLVPRNDSTESSLSDLFNSPQTSPTLTAKQGVSTMLKFTNTKEQHKDKDDDFDVIPTLGESSASNASASSSSSTAPVKTLAQEVSSTPLGKALFDMENYIYHVKPLSTIADKAVTSQYSYSSFTRDHKFDMIDADLEANTAIEEEFIAALMETRAEDATSRATFLKKLDKIYGNTSYVGTRFPTTMKGICTLFKDNLDPKKDQSKTKEYVEAAQELFKSSAIPGDMATAKEVTDFVKTGRSSKIDLAIVHSIETLPEKADNVKFNQREALLAYRMVELYKAKRNPKLDSYEILHLLHINLKMMQKMRPNYIQQTLGAPQDNSSIFDTRVKEALSILENPKAPGNGAKLRDISQTVSELCDQIKGLTTTFKNNAQPSEKKLTTQYLDNLKEFSSSQVVLSSFNGFTKNVVDDLSKSLKKMNFA